MTYKLEFFAADGTRYTFHAPPNKVIWNLEGLGPSPYEIQTTRAPYAQKSVPLGYRLNERQISLILRHQGCSYDEKMGHRDTFIEAFRINRSDENALVPGTLRYTYLINGVKTVRSVDCVLNLRTSLFTSLPGEQPFNFQESLSFTAYDPILYDPTEITAALGSETAALILPVTFPFVLGVTDLSLSITYAGTWDTYPSIEITGPTYYVTLINESTGARINLDYVISAGETVTINPSEATVTNNFNDNLIAHIIDSDLTTFTLRPDPLVTGGVNDITAYVQGYVSGTTAVKLYYYNRYVGI